MPAVALAILAPSWAPLAGLALALRLVLAWTAAVKVLNDPAIWRRLWLLPAEDVCMFITWVLGFFGNKLTWRGHQLVIARDGTVETPEMFG